jgi:rod shape-determining protein MreC
VRVRDLISKHRTKITFAALILACLITLAVSTGNLNFQPKRIGASIVGIFQQAASAVGRFISGTVSSVRELSTLRREYAELLEQVRESEATVDEIAMVRAENDRLREALSFQESLQYDYIPARVIGKEPGTYFAGLTINKGSASGIHHNAAVLANQDGNQGLVGRVATVGLVTSVIMPLFDADSYVAARLLNSRHEGLISGDGNNDQLLAMHYVSKAARSQVTIGEIVITSGMRSLFPEGIRIGTVHGLASLPYETSLSIQVEPAVDFSRLEYVFVLAQDEDAGQ